MSEEILKRVIRVLSNAQKIPVEDIHPESSFEALGIDSLDALQLLFHLESEFNVNIPDDAAREVKDVRGLAEGIEALMAQKTA